MQKLFAKISPESHKGQCTKRKGNFQLKKRPELSRKRSKHKETQERKMTFSARSY